MSDILKVSDINSYLEISIRSYFYFVFTDAEFNYSEYK